MFLHITQKQYEGDIKTKGIHLKTRGIHLKTQDIRLNYRLNQLQKCYSVTKKKFRKGERITFEVDDSLKFSL